MKCQNCGKELREGLKFCPHCGNQIVNKSEPVEQSKSEIASEETAVTINIEPESSSRKESYIELVTYKCSNCGANLSYSGNTLSTNCPYCGTVYVVKKETIQEEVRPEGILPFLVTQDQAIEQFRGWLVKGFWAPHNMSKLTKLNDLIPIFVPVWVFSTNTKTNWSGRSGMRRSRQKAYVDSDGNTQYKTENYTDWFPVNGIYEGHYQAVPVPGSKTLIEHVAKMRRYNGTALTIIDGYDYKSLEPFDSRYIAKLSVDTNIITSEEAMPSFIERMKLLETNACKNMIPGDEKILEHLNMTLDDIEQKLIYVPLYLSSFYYKKKLFHFIVNGRSKVVATERKPVSIAKVVITMAIFFFIIALLVLGR